MDPDVLQTWAVVLLLVLGPGAAIGVGAYLALKRTAFGRGILARNDHDGSRLQALAGDVDDLRQQMLELQERVDFSERMVVQLLAGQRPLELDPDRTPTPPENPALR